MPPRLYCVSPYVVRLLMTHAHYVGRRAEGVVLFFSILLTPLDIWGRVVEDGTFIHLMPCHLSAERTTSVTTSGLLECSSDGLKEEGEEI